MKIGTPIPKVTLIKGAAHHAAMVVRGHAPLTLFDLGGAEARVAIVVCGASAP